MKLRLKRFLPKTLFVRACLIVALPMILVQVVAVYAFYARHWDSVTRRMAAHLAGEIAFLSEQKMESPRERAMLSHIFTNITDITVSFQPGAKLSAGSPENDEFAEFRSELDARISMPFAIERLADGENMKVRVQLPNGTLDFLMSVKRLESSTPLIFILWMTASSLLFLLVAILFLRNQVRPIRALALAAENFGKGQDYPGFRPSGAAEVRQAARAFLVMRERIQRQIRSRTEMLAGISHDLRTPLTRMKLELAMMDKDQARAIASDVSQMEHMIAEYLDFARGDAGEEISSLSLAGLLNDMAEEYRRLDHTIAVEAASDAVARVRPLAFRRMLANLIDNALRYGKRCRLALRTVSHHAEITVEDDGPGISPEFREEAFRPFSRLDASRNLNAGGVGLGLAIARDIARSHGGNITLSESDSGGLRVIIRLPL